jgi:uncharacterized NAD(P)/FAD-binding protein YdhS
MSIKLVDTRDIGLTVAIVGAGASGTLLAAHLLRTGSARVALIERGDRMGRGVAYGTAFPGHLLNVPAASLSGLPEDPEHFLRFARGQFDPATELTTFVPRLVYGRYLEAVLDESEQAAGPGASLLRRRGEVVAIAPGAGGRCLLTLADGSYLHADRAVLALGNQPPRDPALGDGSWPEDPARYVRDPWRDGALESLAEGKVLLVGTGLTMVDIALRLQQLRPGQEIVALSRGGLLPHAHRAGGAALSSGLPVPEPAPSVVALLRFVRSAAAAAELGGGDWRDAINALRPVTSELWAGLPEEEQRRFLDRLVRFWDTHRHRLAPQVATAVAELRASGRLTLVSGRIRTVTEDADGLGITVHERTTGQARGLRVSAVVNCTGPNGDVRSGGSRLLAALCAAGTARPHPLALGLDTCADGALRDARGRESETLFAIGPLRRGELWETTAIPEIRAQAQALAQRFAQQRSFAALSG